MITQLTSTIDHRICYCPVISQTVEVRVMETETIRHGGNNQKHIRILSRTLEDCSGMSECGIIRAVEGISFIVDWQSCLLTLSLQTGRQVWNTRVHTPPPPLPAQ